MKLLFVIVACTISILSLVQCSPFSNKSGKNQFMYEDEHITCVNIPHKIISITFGDFVYASNLRQWRSLNGRMEIPYENVLLYAKTENPAYDYYIVLDSVAAVDTGYSYMPKLVNDDYVTLIISKKAPQSDSDFIFEGIGKL